MRRKALETRRQRLRKIAEADAQQRCDFCRKPQPLLWHPWTREIDGELVGRYCSDECVLAAEDRDRVMGVLRAQYRERQSR